MKNLLLAVVLLGGVIAFDVRGAVFSNPSSIGFSTTTPGGIPGASTPYPSAITVSGVSGTITKVTVTLTGINHDRPDDIQVLLVGPTGAKMVLMADVGGTLVAAANVNAIFDDAATFQVPDAGPLTNGVYRPTCVDFQNTINTDFPAPAPAGPYSVAAPRGSATLASVFNGTLANGTWNLYTVDDVANPGVANAISGGWSLNITGGAIQATVTTLASTPNPSFTTTPGNSVTFTATVTSNGVAVGAQGTVTFREGAAVLGGPVALNASGQASFTTSLLSEGTHAVTAFYNGTAALNTSSGGTTQVVDNHTTVNSNRFCNLGVITIPDTGSPSVPAAYPSHIFVGGLTGTIAKVTLTLSNITHANPDDLKLLLVGPGGAQLVVLGNVGGSTPISNITLTLDDVAASVLPGAGPLVAGAFRPSFVASSAAVFPTPAPSGPYNQTAPGGVATLASVFNSGNPNGRWSLYVIDDVPGNGSGSIGAWCLTFTTSGDAATTTTLASSLNPSLIGQSVSLTSTVRRASDSALITVGTVTFREGATLLGGPIALNASGTATFTTVALSEGTHVISADYNGNPGAFNISSGSITQIVDRATVVSGNTFCNPSSISIPDTGSPGTASIYPSHIFVSGLPTQVSRISVTLSNLSHPRPDDLDILLVGPTGAKYFLISDVGGTLAPGFNVTLTLDDAAGPVLADAGPLTNGTARPSAYDSVADAFPAPAPAAPYQIAAPAGAATLASVFNNTNPNGTWSLYVVDDVTSPGDVAQIAGGWCLTILGPLTTVTNIARNGPSSTNGSSVSWTVSFTNQISGLTSANFALVNTGLGGSPAITSVSPVGSSPASNWVVTASTGSGDGTLGLNLVNGLNLSRSVVNIPFTGQVYTFDRSPPTVTISAPSIPVTTTGPVIYTITYSGATAVTLSASDVVLNRTYTINGTVGVSGSGTTTRTVTISGITGAGSMGISLLAGTATDGFSLAPAAGPSATFRTPNYATVINANDSGAGSLRQAIADVTAPGLIDFTGAVFSNAATAVLNTVGDTTFGPSALRIDKAITIAGPAGANRVTLNRPGGAPNMRLFYVATNGNLTLKNLLVSGGLIRGGAGGSGYQRGGSGGGGGGFGGAIFNQGVLAVNDSTLFGNQAFGGTGGGAGGAGQGSGGGGGGVNGDGAHGGASAIGGAGGAPQGGVSGNGSGGGGPGGNGGGGGGGGSGTTPNSSGPGGLGGFGGGGGGGGAYSTTGFGGGTGGSGGMGGFGGGGGAGGGGTPDGTIGYAGFGGGNGSHGDNSGNIGSGGGGGAGMGGAIFNHAGIITISNTILSANSAVGGAGGSFGIPPNGNGLGAAIFNRSGTLIVTNSVFSVNLAGIASGGIYTIGGGTIVDVAPQENCLRAYYPFENLSVIDTSGSSTASYQGGGPIYWNTDHRGQSASAIALNDPGFGANNYYRLLTATPNNSGRDLGLKGDFTVSAWIYPRVMGGDKMVLGNTGPGGTGALHLGLRGNTVYFGFWGNDIAGAKVIPLNTWTHVVWSYDSLGGQMAIYVNGQLDASAVGRPNTTKDADLVLGFSEALPGSYFQGYIDEFAIFCDALAPNQIAALAAPAGPPPSAVLAPRTLTPSLALPNGCNWSVREIYTHTNDPAVFPYDLPTADYMAASPQFAKVTNYFSTKINRADLDDQFGDGSYFGNKEAFALNNLTPQGLFDNDDNYFVLVARTTIQIPVEDDYTFGFNSDDGARLRVLGALFTSSTQIGGGNPANPAHRGDTLSYPGNTALSATLGVTHLKPGAYDIEFLMWEVGGSSFVEVFAASGARTSVDSSFSLLSPRPFLPHPLMTIALPSPTQVRVSWSPTSLCDRLQSAPTVLGPWTDLPGAVSGQVLPLNSGTQFFRMAQ